MQKGGTCIHACVPGRPALESNLLKYRVSGGGSQAVCEQHPGQTSPISRPDLSHLPARTLSPPSQTTVISQPDLSQPHLPAWLASRAVSSAARKRSPSPPHLVAVVFPHTYSMKWPCAPISTMPWWVEHRGAGGGAVCGADALVGVRAQGGRRGGIGSRCHGASPATKYCR